MSKKALSVVALALMVVGLSAESAKAKTVVVQGDGGTTCNPGPQHFTTIQAAVNAVPPGSTVLVCPGIYPEQVVISQTLLLKGVIDGTKGAAIITVPAGGLLPNATTPAYGLVAAQVLVQGASNVRVDRLTVDGSGGTCPTLVGANRSIGIAFLNVGDPTWLVAAGFISNDVVRNQYDGCGLGEAIDVENSYITITSNEVHDFDLDGVVLNGGSNDVKGNAFQNGLYGVVLHGATLGLIDDNTFYTARGIVLDNGTTGAKITNNVVGPFVGTGIFLNQVSGNTVGSNNINVSSAGIDLFGSSGNTVTGNTIVHSFNFGIIAERSAGGNTIINNTINEANFGFVNYQSAGTDVTAPNTYVNVTTTFATTPF